MRLGQALDVDPLQAPADASRLLGGRGVRVVGRTFSGEIFGHAVGEGRDERLQGIGTCRACADILVLAFCAHVCQEGRERLSY